MSGSTFSPTPTARSLDSRASSPAEFVSIWIDGPTLLAQLYDEGGVAVGVPFELNHWAGDDFYFPTPSNPSVAALPSGGFVVTWEATGAGVMTRIVDAAGTPLDEPDLIAEEGAGHGRFAQPVVAVLSSGDFVVAYTTGDGVRAQLYDLGGDKIGTDFAVSGGFYPQAVGLAGGGFVITWAGSGAQFYDADGNPVGSPADLTPGGTGVYDIVALSSGNLVAVWQTGDGEIHGSRFTRPRDRPSAANSKSTTPPRIRISCPRLQPCPQEASS